MQHNQSPEHSLCRAMTIVAELDGQSTATDAEASLLNHGDDILDVVIGLREMVRNKWLFGCQTLPVGAWKGDAISIGSGPSLDEALPKLKELQNTVLLVAAHSALPKLLAADIVPHVIAPKERDPPCGLVPQDLPPSVIYAGLPCVPDVPNRCKHHWLVGTCDTMLNWLGFGAHIGSPLTSGTLSAEVAANLANSVHLIGHDLTYGHYAGFKMPEEIKEGEIECVDGIKRESCLTYRRARDYIGHIAENFVVVQCAPRGAVIPGRLSLMGNLPKLGDHKVELPTTNAWGRRNENAEGRFKARIRLLAEIMQEAERRANGATSSAGLSSEALFGEHALVGAALFQTVYLSTAILKRTQGLTNDEAFAVGKEAIVNAMDGMRNMWTEMAHECA